MSLIQAVRDPEDVELDRLWRERFGEPLPMLGCGAVAWQVLDAEDAFKVKGLSPIASAMTERGSFRD